MATQAISTIKGDFYSGMTRPEDAKAQKKFDKIDKNGDGELSNSEIIAKRKKETKHLIGTATLNAGLRTFMTGTFAVGTVVAGVSTVLSSETVVGAIGFGAFTATTAATTVCSAKECYKSVKADIQKINREIEQTRQYEAELEKEQSNKIDLKQ